MFRNYPADLLVVLLIVLLIFGPKRLPALGRSLREFKESITGDSKDDDAERPAITQASAQPAPPPEAAREAADIRSERRP